MRAARHPAPPPPSNVIHVNPNIVGTYCTAGGLSQPGQIRPIGVYCNVFLPNGGYLIGQVTH